MRKFYSLAYLKSSFEGLINRFPTPFLLSGLATFFGLITINWAFSTKYKLPTSDLFTTSLKLTFTLFFASVLFTGFKLVMERHIKPVVQYVLLIVLIAFVFVFYFSIPNKDSAQLALPFISAAIAFIFMASGSFLFTKQNEDKTIWLFLYKMVLGFALAILYAGALMLASALIFGTIDTLFKTKMVGFIARNMFVFLSCFFAPMVFLAQIPKVQNLTSEEEYPSALSLFSRVILVPAEIIYLVILYLYVIGSIVTFSWPVNVLAYVIVIFSIVTIVSWLAIYPIRVGILGTFRTVIFILLFPMALTLMATTLIRVGSYGITELRYFLVAYGIWLACVAVFFILTKNTKLKFIPISLIVFLFVSAYGPLSAFKVSERSQKQRLEKILILNNMFKDGKVVLSTNAISSADQQDVISIVEYLVNSGKVNAIKSWFSASLPSKIYPSDILKMLNISDYPTSEDSYVHFSTPRMGYKEVEGFDYEYEFNVSDYKRRDQSEGGANSFIVDLTASSIVASFNRDIASFNLVELFKKLEQESPNRQMPSDKLTIESEGLTYHYKLVITEVSYYSNGGNISYVNGYLLVRRK